MLKDRLGIGVDASEVGSESIHHSFVEIAYKVAQMANNWSLEVFDPQMLTQLGVRPPEGRTFQDSRRQRTSKADRDPIRFLQFDSCQESFPWRHGITPIFGYNKAPGRSAGIQPSVP